MIRLIAHRGNIYGPSPYENQPSHIETALAEGFDVEVDVWYIEGTYFLGHGEPQYPVPLTFLTSDFDDESQIWCHAKNKEAFEHLLNDGMHCFWHEADKYTLTSRKVIWTYPKTENVPNSVWNQPEWGDVGKIHEVTKKEMDKYVGVCSNYVALLRKIYIGTETESK